MPESLNTSAIPVTDGYGFIVLKMILASVLVVVLAYVILRFVLPYFTLKKRNAKSSIEVLDYQALDAKHGLYIVQIENQRLVVGVSETHITKIADLSSNKENSL